MRRLILIGVAVTAALFNASSVDAHRLNHKQQADADRYAVLALRYTKTESASFDACIINGYRVYEFGTFIGRKCHARDGETWFAGIEWRDGDVELVTGP